MKDKAKNTPTILIVLGATGDLMARKVSPALFELHKRKLLPDKFEVVGFSRRPLSDEQFANHIFKSLKKHGGVKARKEAEKFLKGFSYEKGDLGKVSTYKGLQERVDTIDERWGMCSNKLFYLAIPPELYEGTLKNLSKSGLTDPCSPEEGWTRVLVEKPFGKDADTAASLDALLGELFQEEQIYRIDHYLAKEMLQNILSFRFSNNLFEETWNNKFIESVDISMWETNDASGRGRFYDGLGAFRDVGQNHLLQMLALVTMDHPEALEPEPIRQKRAEVLKTLITPTTKHIKDLTYRAQYQGYKKVEHVKPSSKTETYFKVGAYLNHPRWQGVPITMESGKGMSSDVNRIVVTFKHPSPCLCPAGSGHYKNTVTFSIEPYEGIKVVFWSKKPGLNFEIEEQTLNVKMKDSADTQYTKEYGKLLLDCISGDQTLFVSTDEVKEMWRFTDPVVDGWREGKIPLEKYPHGSDKPSDKSLTINDHMLQETLVKESKYTLPRQMGIVGLGKMGSNLPRPLISPGWRVIGYNRTKEPTQNMELEGLEGAYSPEEMVQKLKAPRIVWLMVPAGKPVDDTIETLGKHLQKGDVIIDGGNSYFKDSVSRHKKLQKLGIHFIDAGVSGGPSGALHGSTIMIGGDKKVALNLETLFNTLAIQGGYEFFNEPGSGHFVKMVHNGIEYGMMQAIAEGFNIMKKASYRLNLADIARVYNHGSVIESRLIGWLKDAFEIYGEDLRTVSSTVGHTGEGAWTVKSAKEMKLKAKIIEESLNFRKMSAKNPSYTGKILSALRNQFGGHQIKK